MPANVAVHIQRELKSAKAHHTEQGILPSAYESVFSRVTRNSCAPRKNVNVGLLGLFPYHKTASGQTQLDRKQSQDKRNLHYNEDLKYSPQDFKYSLCSSVTGGTINKMSSLCHV